MPDRSTTLCQQRTRLLTSSEVHCNNPESLLPAKDFGTRNFFDGTAYITLLRRARKAMQNEQDGGIVVLPLEGWIYVQRNRASVWDTQKLARVGYGVAMNQLSDNAPHCLDITTENM